MTLIAMPPREVYVTRMFGDGTWGVVEVVRWDSPLAVGLATARDATVRAEALNWLREVHEAKETRQPFVPSDVDDDVLGAYEQLVRDGELWREWRRPDLVLDDLMGPWTREEREAVRKRGQTDQEE